MTETEWLTNDVGTQFTVLQQYASIRKLRLLAAAVVRHLQPCPENVEAKCCDDLLEAAADNLMRWEEIESELDRRPGNWRFARILFFNESDKFAIELRKFVAFTDYGLRTCPIAMVHELLGNPFRPITLAPAHRTPIIASLARAAYDERQLPSGKLDPHRLAVLADALDEVGAPGELMAHLRGPGPHVRGCWTVDLCLGLS